MAENSSPPGWFTDDAGRVQWWDGERWTEQYLDEQPAGGDAGPGAGPGVGRRIAVAVVSVLTLVLLGVVLLAWLGRGERVIDLVVAMLGPLVGVVIGSAISTRKSRARVPKRRPWWWHAGLFAVLTAVWLVFVAGVNGGLDGGVVVPVVVLTVLGAGAMTAGSRVASPETFA